MKDKEKKDIGIPIKCPSCRSTRTTIYQEKRDGIMYKGSACLKCNYVNARRLKLK